MHTNHATYVSPLKQDIKTHYRTTISRLPAVHTKTIQNPKIKTRRTQISELYSSLIRCKLCTGCYQRALCVRLRTTARILLFFSIETLFCSLFCDHGLDGFYENELIWEHHHPPCLLPADVPVPRFFLPLISIMTRLLRMYSSIRTMTRSDFPSIVPMLVQLAASTDGAQQSFTIFFCANTNHLK